MLNSNQLESKQLEQMFAGNNAKFKMAATEESKGFVKKYWTAGRMLNKSISLISWVMILYKVE